MKSKKKVKKERKKTLSLFAFARVESVHRSSPSLSIIMQHLVLDRDVRDWVLVPLTLCIALMMLMRQYATVSLMMMAFCFRIPSIDLAFFPSPSFALFRALYGVCSSRPSNTRCSLIISTRS